MAIQLKIHRKNPKATVPEWIGNQPVMGQYQTETFTRRDAALARQTAYEAQGFKVEWDERQPRIEK